MELKTNVLSETSQTRTSIACFFLIWRIYVVCNTICVCDIKEVGSYVERGRETVKSRGSWERVVGMNISKSIMFLSRNVITHYKAYPFIQ